MQELKIDAARLWASLQETAAFGAIPGDGLCRTALSEADRLVRDWFRDQAKAVGCSVEVDEVGNMFARRAGTKGDLDPIGIGSHLDTQPTGGRFDGVLGVLAGLEILRTMHDAGFVTNAPLEVVNWTNEEGSRFAPAMLASGVFAGVFSPEFAWSRLDSDGRSFGAELERIGYRGERRPGHRQFAAFLELHIEQGPILHREGLPIGVVTGAQGAKWFDLRLTGSTGHTGATPMALRRNALIGAARVITLVDDIAARTPSSVGTVGSLSVAPNARNVIPGEVHLTIDLRHPDATALTAMEEALKREIGGIVADVGLDYELVPVLDSPPMSFDPRLVETVAQAADLAGLRHRRLVSGAAHDAIYLARVAPTTMIFVPCRDGVTHNVEEFASREHCAGGAQVLLNALLLVDAQNGR